MAQQDNTADDTKRREELRREAKRKGYLLRRSQRHDESYGLYVLIHDSKVIGCPVRRQHPTRSRAGRV